MNRFKLTCFAASLKCVVGLFGTAAFAQNPPVLTDDIEYRSRIQQDFAKFNPAYKQFRSKRTRRAKFLGKEVFDKEKEGSDVACAHQILLEIKWLIDSTADFARIDRRLNDLESVLGRPEAENRARQEDPADGSWGFCYTEWFFKLDATYDYTQEHKPTYPLRFLDRVNSPEKLRSYFSSIAVSNIARDGLDHRRELNESLADLIRLILHDRPAGYSWAPEMKAAIMDIALRQIRSPSTGWWGARYIHDGKTYFVDDLSITFHMLSYLSGKVPDLDKVVTTALALKNVDYPQGWRDDSRYTNHNNMDAVVLFHYGWNVATPSQRLEMAEEIGKMLHWCLTESLLADGSFRISSDDDSVEESEYFGAAFLSRVGFFDRRNRFWTQKDFPEAEDIKRRIKNFIVAHLPIGAAGGTYYRSALQRLDPMKSSNP